MGLDGKELVASQEYGLDLKGGEKPFFASIFPPFSLLLVSGLISLMT